MDTWMCPTPKLLEVMDSSECNDADIDWYMRMPTNPPLVDSWVEMPLKLCEEEDVILDPIPSETDNQLLHWDVKVCFGIKSYNMQIQYVAGKFGKKRRYCPTLIT